MQCHLSWDTYKKNICNGFSNLQQREEFVDMTIAADGHLVKVHRNLIALASPYIKQMIISASCQHPVIFLNNVSNEVLCYILEYIYTGEVGLPVEKINSFIEAAKALKISGLESVVYPVCERKSEMTLNRNEQKTSHIKKSRNRNILLKSTNPSIMKQLIVQNGPINGNDLPETANERVYNDNDINIHSDDDIVDTAENIHNDNDIVDTDDNNDNDLIDMADEKVYNDIDLVDMTDDIHIDNDVINTTDGDDRVHVVLQENIDYKSAIQPSSISINAEEITDIDTNDKHPYLLEKNYILPNNMDAQPIVCGLESKIESEWNNCIPTINITTKTETHSSNLCNYNLEIQRLPDEKQNPADNTNIRDKLEKSAYNCNQSISTHEDVDMNLSPADNTNVQDNLEQIVTNNYNQNISTHDDVDMQTQEVQPATVTNNEDQIEYPRITINIDKLMAHGSHKLETEGRSTLLDSIANPPLYALSNKGSMQLILNRYMYYLHHTSQGGRKRRWRCIDYRRQKCKAFIDTDNEIIMGRAHEHCHTFHDNKILMMGQRRMMYTSIKQVSCTEENNDAKQNGEKKKREPPKKE